MKMISDEAPQRDVLPDDRQTDALAYSVTEKDRRLRGHPARRSSTRTRPRAYAGWGG
jgi:hypothetical protein